MSKTFFCIDAHTCGNPVRLVAGGGPLLQGKTMSEKRQHFLKEFDWIRKGLMFEPRGHDMMSGSILYPPSDPANDIGVLFIETSGCLPINLEVPAGLVRIEYKQVGKKVKSVKIRNVKAYLAAESITADCPDLGELTLDVSYGGNFYAIVDPQPNFAGLENYTADQLVSWSRDLRKNINKKYQFVHPENPTINGCSHILWAGKVIDPTSTARNAVFYGDKAIDRSPCGTGTSARLAQWYAKGKLKPGENFVHESIIGSKFIGRIEEVTELNGKPAIIPSVEGWAKIYGHNTITIDPEDDPYAYGFQVI